MFRIKAGDIVRLRDGKVELEVLHVSLLGFAECRWFCKETNEHFTKDFHILDLVRVSSIKDNSTDRLAC